MPHAFHHERAKRIVQKLKRAKSRHLKSFGSDQHGFVSKPPLSEKKIAAFEKEHDVALPEGYRIFLNVVGNGGAGPYYGIEPLSKADDLFDWMNDDVPVDVFSKPCPLDPEDLSAFKNCHESDAAWDKMCASFYGTLTLASRGCTFLIQLILNGPLRGRVVYCDVDGGEPHFPADTDFLSWFERWLDELLEGRSTDNFGYGPIGSEASFLETLSNPRFSNDDRATALTGLWRLTTLSPESVNAVTALREHEAPSLRALALALSSRHRFDRHFEYDKLALDDESDNIRHEAYRRLLKTNATEIRDQAFHDLANSRDADLAFSIYYALAGQNLLSQQELLSLLDHEDNDIVSEAISRINFDQSHQAQLLHLTQNEHGLTRLRACQTLAKLKIPKAYDAIERSLTRANIDHLEHLLTALATLGDSKSADLLLSYVGHDDDFIKLAAIRGLCVLGDPRIIPYARAQLQNDARPKRTTRGGSRSHVKSIAALTGESLALSPEPAIHQLR